jgi:regulator of sirC expression with transglutaminase-like and TPR domain
MNYDDDFSGDSEFQKLLGRATEVDLTIAALELARDAYPHLNFGPVFRWIDERADEVQGPLALARSEEDALRELGRCIAGKHGITGRADCFDSADSSFLNRVIEQKFGIPISLSVLYMAVAGHAGYPLEGVSAPGHFLTRYDGMDGPLFVDAFAGGLVQTLPECVARMESTAGLAGEAALSALAAVGPRAIIIRMLNNLKALYARQSSWQPACTVQRRLVALQPASYGERRDLALISLKAEHAGQAIDLLEDCLKTCPADETQLLEQQLAEARKQVVRWN